MKLLRENSAILLFYGSLLLSKDLGLTWRTLVCLCRSYCLEQFFLGTSTFDKTL